VDPRIAVRGGATLFEAGGLGAALRPPVCTGQSPGGGRERSPRKLPNLRNFIGFITFLLRSHFYYIFVITNGERLIE
jgi:hypothetical protein